MAGLIKAEILHLSDLYLGDGAAAAAHLPQSFWPQLRRLSLADNALDDTAMAFLAKGNWPKLETLSLYGNEVSVLGFELLMAGHWPQLCNLTLDGKNVSAASWTLFSLVDSVPDGKKRSSYFVASRGASRTFVFETAVWPKLRTVQFRPGWRSSDTMLSVSVQVTDKGTMTKPVRSASICSTGVQCGYPTQETKSTQCLKVGNDTVDRTVHVDKQQPTEGKRRFWQQMMDWSALACLAWHMWLFRRRTDQICVLDCTFYLCLSTDIVWTFRSVGLNTVAEI